MVLAVFKGMSRGFIVAVFSFFSFIIGLAAALKLSAAVAEHLHTKTGTSGYWLPILSFMLVFTAVAFLVRFGARIIKKTAGILFLGWVDSLLGILLYAVMYLMIFSVVLFFATRIHFISHETQKISKTYSFIAPFGPKVVAGLAKILPFFSNMFSDLSRFFGDAAKNV